MFSERAKDNYMFLSFFSNQRLNAILPGGMVSEGDVSRSGLLPQLVGDDLHLLVPEDSNRGEGSSEVDAHGPSSLHLHLDQVSGLVKWYLCIKKEEQKSKLIN